MKSIASFSTPFSSLRLFGRFAVGVALALSVGCHAGSDTGTVLTQLDEARRLAADLRVQFAKATDASNRAVMAETDEASKAAASDAQQTTHVVETDVASLTPLLSQLGFPEEIRLGTDFTKQFSAYKALDHDVLALAVENTNLKAQRLSFGPAREAAEGFRAELETAAHPNAAKDQWHVQALVAQALLAVREIQVLQAPHIAEPDDASMTRMEKDMASRQAAARTAVEELSGLVESKASIAPALAALDHFKAVCDELIGLSRRNTNVRSLDLSLRTKPPLTAACDEILRQLQEALAKEESKATR